MPKDTGESKKAFWELIRILERAVTAGADCLELEWEGQDLVAYQYSGTRGIGAESIREDMREAVVREIGNRANLRHNPTGRILLTLHGKEYEIFVKEYDGSGGSALTLRLTKARRGSR